MIDRLVQRVPGRSCLAIKRVSINDPGIRSGRDGRAPELSPFFLIEAMSQAAALAAAAPAGGGGAGAGPRAGFLAAIRDFRAGRRVAPGDTLEIRAEVLGRFGGLVKVAGRVDLDGETVGEAELTLSVPREVDEE
jgi:3-hydroxyacyl-[acyl-carrier-protein] dehydratase